MSWIDWAIVALGAFPVALAVVRVRWPRRTHVFTVLTVEQRCDQEGDRYARGEIDVDELERRLERLLEGKPTVEPVKMPGSMSMAEFGAALASLTCGGRTPRAAARELRGPVRWERANGEVRVLNEETGFFEPVPPRSRGALTPARTPTQPPAKSRLVPLDQAYESLPLDEVAGGE